jgi:hypothetical protein
VPAGSSSSTSQQKWLSTKQHTPAIATPTSACAIGKLGFAAHQKPNLYSPRVAVVCDHAASRSCDHCDGDVGLLRLIFCWSSSDLIKQKQEPPGLVRDNHNIRFQLVYLETNSLMSTSRTDRMYRREDPAALPCAGVKTLTPNIEPGASRKARIRAYLTPPNARRSFFYGCSVTLFAKARGVKRARVNVRRPPTGCCCD